MSKIKFFRFPKAVTGINSATEKISVFASGSTYFLQGCKSKFEAKKSGASLARSRFWDRNWRLWFVFNDPTSHCEIRRALCVELK